MHHEPIRLRKYLAPDDGPPAWPAGIKLAPVSAIDPAALHALLAAAYADGAGTLAPLDTWWASVVADEEYDPDLMFIAVDEAGQLLGLALCWSSGFIKDVAVHSACRRRGIGETLLRTAFNAFRRRGVSHVDLKVVAGNEPALRLYRRLGMIEVQG